MPSMLGVCSAEPGAVTLPRMRNIVIAAVVVAAAFFGWKKYQAGQAAEPAPVTDSNKTPGANAENRVNGLSGAAPVE